MVDLFSYAKRQQPAPSPAEPQTNNDDFGFPESELPEVGIQSTSKFTRNQHAVCDTCGGSGQYRGESCYTCNGSGGFKVSAVQIRNAKRHGKGPTRAEALAAFEEAHPGLSAFLMAATWSTFAQDLYGNLQRHGFLTFGQIAAARSMQTKVAARAAEREAQNTGAAVVDLAPIRAMFEIAVGNGAKKAIYRAAGLTITLAKPESKNPGALYVKRSGEYLGKLIGVAYSGKPAPELAAIAADPRGEAVKYAIKTGRCSCCGAELSDPESVKLGIGPICAAKWGL